MHRSAGIYALVALVALTGCGPARPPKAVRTTEEKSASQPPIDSQQPHVIDHSVENSVVPLQLKSEKSVSELDRDLWDSETFTHDADAQLKLLAKFASLQGPIRSKELATLVTDDFTARVPSQDAVQEAFSTTRFSVSRAVNNSKTKMQLLPSVVDWERWLPTSLTRVKFKTFGVDVQKTSAHTTVWMRAVIPKHDRYTRRGIAKSRFQG